MIKRLVQYFEDDVRGTVKFIDVRAQHHAIKARAAHIKLSEKIPRTEAKLLRQLIADDINERL